MFLYVFPCGSFMILCPGSSRHLCKLAALLQPGYLMLFGWACLEENLPRHSPKLSPQWTSAGVELILKLGPLTLNCNKCRCWVDSETWACYPQLQQVQVLSWFWNLGLLPFHSAFILRLTWRRWTLTMAAEGLVMFIDTLAALKTPLRSAIGPLCAFQLRSFGVVSFAKGCKTGING